MMTGDLTPLINEFMRVIGDDILLAHLVGESDETQASMVSSCTRVLVDEWNDRPWTEKSVNGDILIELYG